MLSPLKIIVLIAIIAAVWYGFQRFGKSGGCVDLSRSLVFLVNFECYLAAV